MGKGESAGEDGVDAFRSDTLDTTSRRERERERARAYPFRHAEGMEREMGCVEGEVRVYVEDEDELCCN